MRQHVVGQERFLEPFHLAGRLCGWIEDGAFHSESAIVGESEIPRPMQGPDPQQTAFRPLVVTRTGVYHAVNFVKIS